MNYGRAFTFVTEDPDWFKKVGIGVLVMFIPMVGQWAVLGWSLEMMRRVIHDETELLPEWGDFAKHVLNGFKETVIGLVYALPAILIYACGYAGFFGLVLAAGGAAETSEDLSAAFGGAGLIGLMCLYCVLAFAILVAALLVPPATALFAATGELSAAFRFAEVFAVFRASMGPYILSLLAIALIAPIAASIGSAACGIGAFFAVVYMRAVSSHLFGQAYKLAKAN